MKAGLGPSRSQGSQGSEEVAALSQICDQSLVCSEVGAVKWSRRRLRSSGGCDGLDIVVGWWDGR